MAKRERRRMSMHIIGNQGNAEPSPESQRPFPQHQTICLRLAKINSTQTASLT